MTKKKLVIIVGGGKTGSHLANLLLKTCEVRVLEDRPQIYEKLVNELPPHVVILGDGTDPMVLEQVGIANADVLAAVTGDDESNLVAASLAKFEYLVERVIMRVNNPRNAWLCTPEMGVDVAVNQADILASLIVEEMSIGDMFTLARLRQGAVEIVENVIAPGSKAVNKSVAELGLPSGCNVTAIIRGKEVIIPDGATVIQAEDELVCITMSDKRAQLETALE